MNEYETGCKGKTNQNECQEKSKVRVKFLSCPSREGQSSSKMESHSTRREKMFVQFKKLGDKVRFFGWGKTVTGMEKKGASRVYHVCVCQTINKQSTNYLAAVSVVLFAVVGEVDADDDVGEL